MAFQVGDLVQVTTEFKGPLDGALVVRNYRVSANTGAGADAQSAAASFWTAFTAVFAPLMSAQASIVQLKVQVILPIPRKRAGYANQVAVPGDEASDLLPKQVCGMLYLLTPLSGQKNMSKVFVPYPYEAANDATGAPTGGYQLDLAALGVVLANDINVGVATAQSTLTPVVYHRAAGTGDAIAGQFATANKWHTQRRRADNRFSFT